MIKKGKNIPIQVRSSNSGGKRLFDWNPADSTVSLISHGMVYRIKLSLDGYTMLEARPKNSLID